MKEGDNMTYFQNINNLEALKKEFFRLAKELHPDNGGNAESFKEMKSQYEKLYKHLETFGTAAGDPEENKKDFDFGLFADVISKIIGLDGLTIELVGSWLWVSGDTYTHKATLKDLGFKWAGKKKAWYLHFEPFNKKRGSKMTLEQIKNKYGSTKIKSETYKRFAAV